MKVEKTSFIRIETAARNALRSYCRKRKAVMGVVASKAISDFTDKEAARAKRKAVKK